MRWLSTVKPFYGPSRSHEGCYISSHPSLKQQVQCLATKVSKLSMTDGKTIHPRVIEEPNTNSVQLRAKKPQNKPCLVNRLSAVSISEHSVRQQLRRRASAVDVVSTDQHFNYLKGFEQTSSRREKRTTAPAVDIVSTASPLNNQITKTCVRKTSTHQRKCSFSSVNGVSSEITLNNQFKNKSEGEICTQLKRRPASAENIIRSDQVFSKQLKDCIGGAASSQAKRRPASAVDIGSTSLSLTVSKQLINSCGGKSSSQLIRNELCPATVSRDDVQLLHPDWRKVPWRPYFGWTDAHEDLCKHLQSQVRRGQVSSIYYGSAEEHCAAGPTWRYRHGGALFLGGPSVSSATEALDVIRRVTCRDVTTTSELMDVAGPGYDGDDEDDVS